ncbi:MAG: ATP-binding protein, partial [Lautropia sp.]
TELLLLFDPQQQRVAGNFEIAAADLAGPPFRIIEREIVHNQRNTQGQLLVTKLPDGSSLVVGREMSDQSRIESLVRKATAAAALVAMLLVVGGTWLFRATLEQRVEAIRRTTRQIGSGDLSRRVPPADQEDEFVRLDSDINAMLDRIEGLMDGVRHVSNTIAHELRTPLARILAGLRTADRSDSTVERLRDANRTAVREIEALTLLFEKLLQIAEAESGARRQAFAALDVRAIVRDVVELFEAVAEAQGSTLKGSAGGIAAGGVMASGVMANRIGANRIGANRIGANRIGANRIGANRIGAHRIGVKGIVASGIGASGIAAAVDEPVPLTVLGDRDLLAGALANLIENALKYGGAGATIRVDAVYDDGEIVLTVADDGPGVPDQELGRLGTRFHRLDRGAPGFGLGLTSVRAVVLLHDGSLQFADAGPGLLVRMRLPAYQT